MGIGTKLGRNPWLVPPTPTTGIPTRMKRCSWVPVANERCWIWFRSGLGQDGSWNGGWYGTASPLGGVTIEHYDYVPCRVPEWRVPTQFSISVVMTRDTAHAL